jgi:preprotein translocase subunit Sec63
MTVCITDQLAVIEKSITLCVSLMHISLAHNWLSAYLTVLTLQQHIIQGFHPALSPLLQLPNVTVEQAEELAKRGVSNIPAIVKMPEAERKEVLKDLPPKQYEQAVKVAENWPTLEIIDARFQGKFACLGKASMS